jgi:hypothetical protein
MDVPAHWADIPVPQKRGPAASGAEGGSSRKRCKTPADKTAHSGQERRELLNAVMEHAGETQSVDRAQERHSMLVGLKHGAVQSTIGHRLQAHERTDCSLISGLVQNVSRNLTGLVSLSNYNDVLGDTCAATKQLTRELKSVSKVFEDSCLRQPIHAHERACSRGDDCECMFLDPACPFVGVEYVLPWEQGVSTKKTGGFCLPCLRAATLALYMDILHTGRKTSKLIQRYYNEHSKPGEYRLSSMLIAGPNGPVANLPLPIVRHQRSNYEVYKHSGVVYARQVNVDFR